MKLFYDPRCICMVAVGYICYGKLMLVIGNIMCIWYREYDLYMTNHNVIVVTASATLARYTLIPEQI